VLRSVLFFSEDSARVEIGAAALRASTETGMRGRLIRSIKRFLPVESFTETRIGTRRYTLEELVAVFLRNLRERANAVLDRDVRSAVIGCPARFSDDPAEHLLALSRLRKAAELAGFREIALCEEPVAAALDCAQQAGATELVVVLDLGGGTSDFTVARLGDRAAEVLAVGGVAVAGDALDGSLMRSCIAPEFGSEVRYRRAFGSNVLTFPRSLLEKLCSPAELCLLDRRDVLTFLREIRSSALDDTDRESMDRLLCLVEDRLGFRLFESIDATKRELSRRTEARFEFDYPGIELDLPISRPRFESAAQTSLRRILERLDETLAQAGVTSEAVDRVYCTGGTAKVPALHDAVAARFGAHKVRHVSTFHAVIQGLAERARDLVARGELTIEAHASQSNAASPQTG
ncbi:MAG TPA: Hsp70 family protein, partial [Polyangiaceae bacterium]